MAPALVILSANWKSANSLASQAFANAPFYLFLAQPKKTLFPTHIDINKKGTQISMHTISFDLNACVKFQTIFYFIFSPHTMFHTGIDCIMYCISD